MFVDKIPKVCDLLKWTYEENICADAACCQFPTRKTNMQLSCRRNIQQENQMRQNSRQGWTKSMWPKLTHTRNFACLQVAWSFYTKLETIHNNVKRLISFQKLNFITDFNEIDFMNTGWFKECETILNFITFSIFKLTSSEG